MFAPGLRVSRELNCTALSLLVIIHIIVGRNMYNIMLYPRGFWPVDRLDLIDGYASHES